MELSRLLGRRLVRGKAPVCGIAMLLCAVTATGCSDPKEQYGRTWYIDGAGNWGFGAVDVPLGLQDAGYQGAVTNHRWSLTLNPALDQTLRFLAKESGRSLARSISDYLEKYPDAEANIICLSAGTGVGIWAIENVSSSHKVNNIVMLGSSLSSKYDKALSNMKGNIYVYYAPSDPVLQGPVRLLGTIDGTFDDSAGLVGLNGPGATSGRIVNVGWNPRYRELGWTGGHADCVNRRFVANVLKDYIVSGPSRAVAVR